jgi:glycosyltransferase involved in cell wall biosynthesis
MAETGPREQRQVNVAKIIFNIPHYRVPVFRRLSANPHVNFTVYAGDAKQMFGGSEIATIADVGQIKGVNWRKIGSRRLKGPLLRYYEWQPEVVALALREKWDAVICLGNKSLSNWLVRIILKVRGIPLIEWTQGVRRHEHGLKWAVRRFYMKWASAHLLYGNFARDFYTSHGFKNDEVFVVYNSLDHDRQLEVRGRITDDDIERTRRGFGVLEGRDRLIFHSGRLEKRKNLPILIEAVERFKNVGRKVVVVLIGDGAEESALRQLVKAKGLDERVIFHGPCYDEDVLGQVISASDLCIVPGGLGLLAMHSFVYGTPILVCDNTDGLHGPEVETVIEGRTGGFFREGDVDDLVEKMNAMLYPEPCKGRMKQRCMELIDTYYTPQYQEKVIIEALNYVLAPYKQIPVP